MKQPRDWLKELEPLAWHHAALGFGPDLAGMTMIGLEALYGYLKRLSD